MKYISLDIETNGTDFETDLILQIGAVAEDTNNPAPLDDLEIFGCYVIHPEEEIMKGNPAALEMNEETIHKILNREKYKGDYLFLTPDQVTRNFLTWLKNIGYESGKLKDKEIVREIVFAGKNFNGFDRLFLNRLPEWKDRIISKFRALDPATHFINWHTDECPPTLDECKKRAGVEGSVTHDALDDAFDIIEIFRTLYSPVTC